MNWSISSLTCLNFPIKTLLTRCWNTRTSVFKSVTKLLLTSVSQDFILCVPTGAQHCLSLVRGWQHGRVQDWAHVLKWEQRTNHLHKVIFTSALVKCSSLTYCQYVFNQEMSSSLEPKQCLYLNLFNTFCEYFNFHCFSEVYPLLISYYVE